MIKYQFTPMGWRHDSVNVYAYVINDVLKDSSLNDLYMISKHRVVQSSNIISGFDVFLTSIHVQRWHLRSL